LKARPYKSASDGIGGPWRLEEGGPPYEIWPFLDMWLKSTVAVGKSLQQQKQSVAKMDSFYLALKIISKKSFTLNQNQEISFGNYFR
jgi:hypothetical protein